MQFKAEIFKNLNNKINMFICKYLFVNPNYLTCFIVPLKVIMRPGLEIRSTCSLIGRKKEAKLSFYGVFSPNVELDSRFDGLI